MADNKFHTGRVLENIQRLKADLPVRLANQAQRFFTESFTNQSWNGDGQNTKWKEVERRIPGTYEYKYPKSKGLSRRTSPILVRTGKLRRAVSNSIRETTFSRIQLVAAVPYAQFLNDGTDTIDKRKFMGDGKFLRRQQKELIIKSIDKIWQA